jgi:hypothetical protein
MLVDRISCRLDSLALERENGKIDTLLCIQDRIFFLLIFIQAGAREEEQSRKLVKNSMYSH